MSRRYVLLGYISSAKWVLAYFGRGGMGSWPIYKRMPNGGTKDWYNLGISNQKEDKQTERTNIPGGWVI